MKFKSDKSSSLPMELLRENVAQLLAMEQRAEYERTKSKEALLHAAKMAAIGRMVAGVNHEIKRPLASMRILAQNSIQLLAQGKSDLIADNLNLIVQIIDQLDKLSCELEGFSRKSPMKCGLVILSEIVTTALGVIAPQTKIGRGKFSVAVDGVSVFADRDRLILILVNIIANALDAINESPNKTIEIGACSENEYILLSVRDHGPGLSSMALAHLFEPFFTTKPPGKGLGLGLALSAEVLAEMGGELIRK